MTFIAALAVAASLSAQTPPPADETRPPAAWWRALGDEPLNDLVEEALVENGDLAATRSRVLAAEAAAFQAVTPTLPHVSFDVTGNVAPRNALGFQFGGLSNLAGGGVPGQAPVPLPAQLQQVGRPRPAVVYYTGSALLSGGVQVDPGRSFFAWRAEVLQAEAAAGERDVQSLELARQVAQTYYDVITAQQQREIIARQVELNREVLRATDLRFEAGEAEGLDVLQQRQNLAAVETLLPRRTPRRECSPNSSRS